MEMGGAAPHDGDAKATVVSMAVHVKISSNRQGRHNALPRPLATRDSLFLVPFLAVREEPRSESSASTPQVTFASSP